MPSPWSRSLPMPVPQISLFGSTRDLKEQLDHIQSLFPPDLYAVGSSAGTGLLVRYLGEQGEDTPFKLPLRCVQV